MSTSFDPSRDIPDMTSKVVLVTGANKGIGLETVKQLALKGAHVYLGARETAKAVAAISALQSQGVPVEKVDCLWVDLSSPMTARQSAEGFLQAQTRLDVLINNAAVPASPHTLSSNGISTPVSTNYLGPYVFTNVLLPLLYVTAQEPDTDLTSSAHKLVANIRVADVKSFNISCSGTRNPAMARHGFSRLLGILFTRELQRRIDEDTVPIIVMAVYPGKVWTDTAKQNQSTCLLSSLRQPLAKYKALPIEKGAYTTLFAATSETVAQDSKSYKGNYLVPFGHVRAPSETASDMGLAKRLWETTERILLRIFMEASEQPLL